MLSSLLPVRTYTRDSSPPMLSMFVSLDMDEGKLVLPFSESVNAGTLDYHKITLQAQADPTYTLNWWDGSH